MDYFLIFPSHLPHYYSNNYPKGMQADFVLGKWNKQEEPVIKLKIEKAATIIEDFATIGIERTMNEVNKMEFVV